MNHKHISEQTMKAATSLFAAASGAGIDLGLPLLSAHLGDALFFPITDGLHASFLMCTPYATFFETQRLDQVEPVGLIDDVGPFISYMTQHGLRGLTDEEREWMDE